MGKLTLAVEIKLGLRQKQNIVSADRLGSQLAKGDHTRVIVSPAATGKLEGVWQSHGYNNQGGSREPCVCLRGSGGHCSL